nr:hypothetical protein GCM10020092_062470 [Actinoplanes digitatis]
MQSRPQAGTWKLSAFPWLVDGVNQAAGATRLRDLTTGREVAVARAERARDDGLRPGVVPGGGPRRGRHQPDRADAPRRQRPRAHRG